MLIMQRAVIPAQEVEKPEPSSLSLLAPSIEPLVSQGLLACLHSTEAELQVAAMRLAGKCKFVAGD